MKRTLALLVLVAGALAMVSQADSRTAPTAVERVTGHWFGYFQSSLTGEVGSFDLAIPFQQNRRFAGTLSSPTLPRSIPFDGTLAASDRFSVIGHVSSDLNFRVKGVVKFFNETKTFGRATADYDLTTPAGRDEGSLLFLQSFDVPNAAQLPPRMSGGFTRDDGQKGTISVELGQKGSDFEGVGMFGDLPFPFRGSIGAFAPGGAPVHAISVSPYATITIDCQWLDGVLIGGVNASFADGSVHTASFFLRAGGVSGD